LIDGQKRKIFIDLKKTKDEQSKNNLQSQKMPDETQINKQQHRE
jgi:hypothetical protein